ncbi:MAG TPA: Rad52/Rad22 family DNA repair protein [Candidatus Ratteibacteria bacterium]|nr:Rad52/Rad22 family DNA repair protein [Candidatus Ratteibacteria bacterium]
MSTITEKIVEINKILDGFGDEAIQEEKRPWGSLWGYKPQYEVDAVNQVLKEDGWGYKLITIQTTPLDNSRITAIAQVEVYIKIGDTLVCKGPQFGVSTNYPGDAEKGAITDGIGKGLSLWGIGSKAYRGLLRPMKEPVDKQEEKVAEQQEKPKREEPVAEGERRLPSKPQLVLLKKLAFERGVAVPSVSSREEAGREIKKLMALTVSK